MDTILKASIGRVEFSKPNIEISITVTKASKPRSFEASVGYIVLHSILEFDQLKMFYLIEI